MSGDADFPPPCHIVSWAGEEGPDRVLTDAFARFERGQALATGTCRLELTQRERRQVGRVLSATWAASKESLRWRELRAGLEANGTTLEAVVRHRCGPWRDVLQDRRDLRQESMRDHDQAVSSLRAALLVRTGAAETLDTAVEIALGGLFGRRTTTADAERITRMLEGLPAPGNSVGLAVLAARVFSDAHALDRTTALGRAVVRFVRLEALVRSGERIPETAASFTVQEWRDAWAGVGVVCDQVSSQVLVLNLPLEGDAPAVAIATAAAGEPIWLTLRSMAGSMSVPSTVPTVFVCENPSIVEAAADMLGAASLPLICTFGRPSAAALQLLSAVGVPTVIKVQADADVTGRAIVDTIVARYPSAVQWRMPETDIVFEEQLVDELLSDLRGPYPVGRTDGVSKYQTATPSSANSVENRQKEQP